MKLKIPPFTQTIKPASCDAGLMSLLSAYVTADSPNPIAATSN
ncbi:hypothetical protein [Bifidobacterium sp.]|nr:hypothetical protein [Bifidobacterium sp.]